MQGGYDVVEIFRRVNLDMIWNRASKTVASNLSTYKNILSAAKYLGIYLSYEAPGPYEIKDNVIFGCALEMVRVSQLKGENKSSHQQFDTIRKISTLY